MQNGGYITISRSHYKKSILLVLGTLICIVLLTHYAGAGSVQDSTINPQLFQPSSPSSVLKPVGVVNPKNLPKIEVVAGNNVPDMTSALRSRGRFSANMRLPTQVYTIKLAISNATPKFGNSAFGFEGLDMASSGGWKPPDVQVAAGPNSVVEMVNLEGEVFTKNGSPILAFSLPAFFGSSLLSDPKIIYDNQSGRWFTSIININSSNNFHSSVFVAVSNSNDPTGNWTLYNIQVGNILPDQPILGISSDKVAISFNGFTCPFGFCYTGSQYLILRKSDMLSGSSVAYQISAPDLATGSIHPVKISSSSTLYMLSDGFAGGTILSLFAVNGTVPNATVARTNITVSTITIPPLAAQPGTLSTVNTGDSRVLDAVLSQNRLWLTLDDACTPIGDNTSRSCVRLIELNATTGSMLQNFDVAANHTYLYYPAISTDGSGNLGLVLGYSSSKPFGYPSVALGGQSLTDAPNTIESGPTLRFGTGIDTSGRYGDYFGAALDPANANIIWVAGEYTTSLFPTIGWSTVITNMTFTTSLVAPQATTSNSIVDQGQMAVLSDTLPTTGTPPYSYQWYEEIPGASSFAKIAGATSLSYNFLTRSATTTSIRPSTTPGLYTFALLISDSSPLRQFNASYIGVNVNTALGRPNKPVQSATKLDLGQSLTLSTLVKGGTIPYSYSFVISNAVNNIFVMSLGPTSSNSVVISATAIGQGILHANVVASDNASTPQTRNSLYAGNFVINPQLAVPAKPTLNTTSVALGDKVLMTGFDSGGTLPYRYKFSVYNAISNVVIGSSGMLSANSFVYTTNAKGTFRVKLTVTDNATTHVTKSSPYSANFLVH